MNMAFERELQKAAGRLGVKRLVDVQPEIDKKKDDLKSKREMLRKKIKPSLYQP